MSDDNHKEPGTSNGAGAGAPAADSTTSGEPSPQMFVQCHRSMATGEPADCIGERCSMFSPIPMLQTKDGKPVVGCLEVWKERTAIELTVRTIHEGQSPSRKLLRGDPGIFRRGAQG